MILGIDAGNYKTKVCTKDGCFSFYSDIGEKRDLNLTNDNGFGDDDMVWEYQGKEGFAGTLARFESEFSSSRKGDTKAHEDAKLRILFAVHRYSGERDNKLIVCQPISQHNDREKKKIVDMLLGDHELTINDVRKKFTISKVNVAAEGAISMVNHPIGGLVHVIDIGSGTINYATLHDMRFIDRDSFSEPWGLETIRTKDYTFIGRQIINHALNKWDPDDTYYLCGGGAKLIYPYLKDAFSDCHLIQPIVHSKIVDPVFGNAAAAYEIGKNVYGR